MSSDLVDVNVGDAQMVIVAAPDMQGRLIGRRIPIDAFVAARHDGVAVSTCVFGWDIAQSSQLIETEALSYTGIQTGMGDCLLIPDMRTYRTAGWLTDTAIVLADATETDGTKTTVAPRQILHRQIDALAGLGYEASIGIELEYFLFEGKPAELMNSGYHG